MALYSWPSTLPGVLLDSFSSKKGVRVLRTSTDAGTPKMRYVGRMAEPVSMSFMVTKAQLETLETFVYDTIKGVFPFEFKHPITGETVNARIVPSGESHYDLSPISSQHWIVSMNMEFLP